MKVLIVSQYFDPEVTAASLRLGTFADGLAAAGHEVEVLCEVPNHPAGVIEPHYRRRVAVRRQMDGYRVTHVWVWARPSKGFRTRLASYGSYAAMASLLGSAMGRPDVILASSPPLPVGLVGALLAARHRVPWVLDVRDLWPEVAVALGELHEGAALSAATSLERLLYRSADAITVTTKPFRDYISERGARGRIEVVPNGTTRAWLAVGCTEPDREAAELPTDRFVWTYAGNLGIAQGLEAAVAAARLLGDGFQLHMVGDGAAREQLRELAGSGPPDEVVFRDAVEPERAAQLMRASDALLVSLADRPALDRCVPGKLYHCCAVRRPVVVAAAGETRSQAERAGAALTVTPGNAEGLARAVRSLRDDASLSARLVEGGERLAAANLREDGVERLAALLAHVAGERRLTRRA